VVNLLGLAAAPPFRETYYGVEIVRTNLCARLRVPPLIIVAGSDSNRKEAASYE